MNKIVRWSIAACVVVGGSAAVLVAGGSGSTATAASGMGAYPEQEAHFAVFRHPATASANSLASAANQVAADLANAPSPTQARPDLVRVAYSDASVTAGVMPTDKGLCFLGTISGAWFATCAKSAEALDHGLAIVQAGPGGYRIAGIMPDGVGAGGVSVRLAGGSAAKFPVDGDGGFSVASTDRPTDMSYSGSDGTMRHIVLHVADPRSAKVKAG